MKANALMIGDWVKTNDLYKWIKDVKVRAISQWSVEDETTYQWIECQHIEPIPLTTEIFEKNGFIGKEEGHYYSYHRYGRLGNEIFNVHYQNHWIACSTPDNRDEFALFGMIILRYVHELQHALRLCGLNNLADNLIV